MFLRPVYSVWIFQLVVFIFHPHCFGKVNLNHNLRLSEIKSTLTVLNPKDIQLVLPRWKSFSGGNISENRRKFYHFLNKVRDYTFKLKAMTLL